MRIGEQYTTDEDFYFGDPGVQGMALVEIANELRKARLLKEYELGVLVRDNDGVLTLTAGQNIGIDGRLSGRQARLGDDVFDEDLGRIDRS